MKAYTHASRCVNLEISSLSGSIVPWLPILPSANIDRLLSLYFPVSHEPALWRLATIIISFGSSWMDSLGSGDSSPKIVTRSQVHAMGHRNTLIGRQSDSESRSPFKCAGLGAFNQLERTLLTVLLSRQLSYHASPDRYDYLNKSSLQILERVGYPLQLVIHNAAQTGFPVHKYSGRMALVIEEIHIVSYHGVVKGFVM